MSAKNHPSRRETPETTSGLPLRASSLKPQAPSPRRPLAASASALAPRSSLLATRRRPARRGVLLLVVLSLLVLFLLIGTAFIITAKQADLAGKTAAKASEKQVARAATGNLLDDALLQLLRDTDNPNSSLRTHSLLGDLYGDDGFKFQISNVQWAKSSIDLNNADPNTGLPTGPAASLPYPGGITGGQMIQFEVDTTIDLSTAYAGVQSILDFYDAPFQPHGANPAAAITRPSQVDGAYNGRVLTFLTGPAKGISTRIVSYHPITDTRWQFTVLTMPLADGTILANAISGARRGTRVLEFSRVLVNGATFNGTGVGLNPIAPANEPKLDAGEAVGGLKLTFGSASIDPPIALLPNMRFFNPDPSTSAVTLPDIATPANALTLDAARDAYFPRGAQNAVGRGGSDETYDAADFQNMFLALMTDDPVDYDSDPVPANDLRTYFASTLGTPSPGALTPSIPVSPPSTSRETVLPSFHRPELIRYWAAHPALANSSADVREGLLGESPLLLRKIMLRPNWLDHPLFTGSNPELPVPGTDAVKRETNLAHMIYGPWDVDNDNDGVRDSVWIDTGAPVIVGPNGKLVKPLVAMLVLDMDGRLNVNAHGSADLAGADDEINDEVPIAGGEESDETPRGIGWGPADISLRSLFDDDDQFEWLVEGNGGNGLVGREGRDQDPGRSDSYDFMPQINQFGFPQWGNQAVRSSFAMPPDFRARYGTAINAFGQLVIEATLGSENGASVDGYLSGDSPYEAALYAEGVESDNGLQAADAPFSLGELERILRAFDADQATQPYRLDRVIDAANSKQRTNITTDSWDLPSPNVAMPAEWASSTTPQLLSPLTALNPATGQPWRRLPQSTAELVEIRVRAVLNKLDATNFPLFPVPLAGDPGNAGNVSPPPPAARLRIIMRQILAPELAAGVRLNINRPLGNGRDDNGNRVVDEPGEDVLTNTGPLGVDGNLRKAWAPSQTDKPGFTSVPLDPNYLAANFTPLDVTFDGEPLADMGKLDDRDAMLQRQLLARHLYVMALTMTAPVDFGLTPHPTPSTPASRAEQNYCRSLAQWAVNIVDFRDADNSMTPFEYDLNPFDGWQPDGDLRTAADHFGPDGSSTAGSPSTPNDDTFADDTFVWGSEQPELVMTETLAWHDRRTQDLANEDDYPPTADPQSLTDLKLSDFDPDYDQLVRPRGAFFVELYNPNPAMPGAGSDTHDVRIATNQQAYDWGVKLSKTHNNAPQGSPVWRLAIYKRTPPGKEPFPLTTASLWDPDDRNARDKDATNKLQVHRPPVVMDRSVYFTQRDPATTRPPGMWDNDGVAFFADETKPQNVGTVRPGRYLVVGGGRDLKGNGIYSSPIGDVANGGQAMPGKPAEWEPRRRVDLTVTGLHTVRLIDFKLDGSTLQDTTDAANPFSVEAPSEVDLANTNLAQQFQTGGSPAPASVADVAIIDQVYDDDDNYDDNKAGGDGNRTRPLTISEPALGYIDRFINTEWIESRGYYGNPAQTAVDIPLDGPIVNSARSSEDIEEALEGRVDDQGKPLWSDQYPIPPYLKLADPAVCRVGELGNDPNADPRISYAFIFLQRLANPTLPWNPEPGHPAHDANLQVNPYMTVDEMSADLTVFNGRPQAPPNSPHGYEEDKLTNNGLGTNTNDIASTFSSLERGYNGKSGAPTATERPSIWFQQRPSQGRATQPIVRPNLYQGKTNNNIVFRAPPFCTLGFLNKSLQLLTPPPAADPPAVKAAKQQLQPQNPLHWLSWNNRPYISGNELAVVPRVRSSMLMREFSDMSNVLPAYSPYVPPTNAQLQSGIDMSTLTRRPYGTFAQLEGFFYEPSPSAPIAPGSPNATADGLPLRLYRLLDFVGTPSLFTGATTWLNPTIVGLGPAVPTGPTVNAANAYDDPRTDRQAPFNNVSTFRDPGRVNLNTISNNDVWQGLFHGVGSEANPKPLSEDYHPVRPTGYSPSDSNEPEVLKTHPGPTWSTGNDAFVRSRRGYGAPGDMLTLDPAMPTLFANPFRSANAADLVPLPNMVRAGVECTLMRSTSASAGIDNNPLFAAATARPSRDMNRNPYFRYEPLVRLNNLTTTRSNVFAVWLTVGFFEVKPLKDGDATSVQVFNNFGGASTLAAAQADPLFSRVYPDGYMIGKEDGLDDGDVRRLRGFYIIDRTRPVGFVPGKDTNVQDTIRLQRRIK